VRSHDVADELNESASVAVVMVTVVVAVVNAG
jgi:hypothetical protein